MKKNLLIPLIGLLILILAACGNEQTSSKQEETEKNQEATSSEKNDKKEEKSIEVDKGLLNVEITLPASFFEGEDIDQVIQNAKADGVKEVTKNEDGSLTYKMSKNDHKKILKEMETSILETIEETKSGEDFQSIQDVVNNNSFTEFTLVVDREGFENSFDGFAALGLGLTGMFYQAFNGVKPDDYKVTIFLKDVASGEVFNTIVYPDALNETK